MGIKLVDCKNTCEIKDKGNQCCFFCGVKDSCCNPCEKNPQKCGDTKKI